VRRAGLLAFLLAALLAGCGAPGSDPEEARERDEAARKIDVAKAGKVTLTVWDQEVRGGQRRQIERLNRAFEQRYPNVTIERVAKSFTDLNTTLELAVSGDRAPDVVQANQGRSVMGQLVKGGLLRPLDEYAEIYGWGERYSEVLLDLNRFSHDGAEFGDGSLYGISQMGEIVGVFYDRERITTPPRTFAEFEQMLAAAKRRGDVAIAFGNLDKWPGIHEFQAVQNAFTPPDQVRDFVFARSGASFDTPENREAAAKLQEWARAGYFTPNFNGTGYDPAYQQFAEGKGDFLIAGTWLLADLTDLMGDRLAFMLMPPREEGGTPLALGGESLPFAITRRAEQPDVAAAYIDFLTNPEASRVLVETGNLPAMEATAEPATAAGADIFAAWKALTERDGLVPYLDYATPSFYDEITAAVQRLLAGRVAPEEFTAGLQEDYAEFADSR
jgi:raffinose/stachyose/melibiose transport system substrate-binding protein